MNLNASARQTAKQSGSRVKYGRLLFSPKNPSNKIAGVLYEENLPSQWQECVISFAECYGWRGVVSPLHQPDDVDKKAHRHILILSNDRKPLNFKAVDFALSYLSSGNGGKYLAPLRIDGGVSGVRRMCRYFIHMTDNSLNKEQFDKTKPQYFPEDFEPIDGKINGLTWIYDEFKGLVTFGDFDYMAYVHYTEVELRERNKKRSDDERDEQESLIQFMIDYISSPDCKDKSFAGVARFALDAGVFKSFVRSYGFYNAYCMSLASYKDDSPVYDGSHNVICDYKSFFKLIRYYISTVDENVIKYVYSKRREDINKGLSDIQCRRIFSEYYSMEFGEVRRKFYDDFHKFCESECEKIGKDIF